MSQAIPLYIGADPREAAGLHVFIQSVMDKASVPVSFIPLHKPMLNGFDGQRDGTNAFIYSRFLVPYIQNYNGWAIFADGFLHRFQWLNDDQIGELPPDWNCLVGEQDVANASLLHHTLGIPGFDHYKHCDASEHWHRNYKRMTHVENG
jgi:hypothetical protein